MEEEGERFYYLSGHFTRTLNCGYNKFRLKEDARRRHKMSFSQGIPHEMIFFVGPMTEHDFFNVFIPKKREELLARS